jgi:hypothetical protein|tara:strand:- start:12 stop:161 length:150 start_codon:yes stop_codon:yes gene_type:complete
LNRNKSIYSGTALGLKAVVDLQDFNGNGEIIVELNLTRENTIKIKETGR